jgi:hypothetical protein
MVKYVMQMHNRPTLTDYMEFLRRQRWKEYTATSEPSLTGKYLDIM